MKINLKFAIALASVSAVAQCASKQDWYVDFYRDLSSLNRPTMRAAPAPQHISPVESQIKVAAQMLPLSQPTTQQHQSQPATQHAAAQQSSENQAQQKVQQLTQQNQAATGGANELSSGSAQTGGTTAAVASGSSGQSPSSAAKGNGDSHGESSSSSSETGTGYADGASAMTAGATEAAAPPSKFPVIPVAAGAGAGVLMICAVVAAVYKKKRNAKEQAAV